MIAISYHHRHCPPAAAARKKKKSGAAPLTGEQGDGVIIDRPKTSAKKKAKKKTIETRIKEYNKLIKTGRGQRTDER